MTVAPDRQQTCRQFLQDIYEVSTALETRTYIWGGMVADILRGAFLRPHHDVDGFTLNLLSIKDEMMARFLVKGYATTYSDKYDMLRVEKGGFHAGLNRLEMDGDTAMWRHVGDQGTIYFPAVWLDATPRVFCGVKTYTSGAAFEYAIKTNVHLLNPEWALRDKDRAALEILSAELDRMGADKQKILSSISSDTPYWVERGYPEYASRITARKDSGL